MKVDYKKEYRDAYNITKRQLENYNPKNMVGKSNYIKRRIRDKEMSDLIEWSGENFYKRVIANATANAIKDHKRDQNKKGLDILGRKLK